MSVSSSELGREREREREEDMEGEEGKEKWIGEGLLYRSFRFWQSRVSDLVQ